MEDVVHRHVRFAVVIACLAVLVPGPVAADVVEPTLRTERAWFHCTDGAKVQTLEMWGGNLPSWDTQPPASSVQDGAGCGFVDHPLHGLSLSGEPWSGADWRGTFVGNLDSITVDVHQLLSDNSVATVNGTGFGVRLFVDGEQVLNDSIDLADWQPENSNVTRTTSFTVAGLGYLVEDGDGTIERDIRLYLFSKMVGETWVFDTTEVPAGLTFNPDAPAARVLHAGK
jgi:hypothetical protein